MSLYVRHVAKSLLTDGHDVILLTTPSALESPGFSLVRAACGEALRIELMFETVASASTGIWSLMNAQWQNWRALRKRFGELLAVSGPDVVYVPTLDWIAKAVEIFGTPFGKVPFVSLYMAPVHHRGSMKIGPARHLDWVYERLFRRLLDIDTLSKILVIDNAFYDYCVTRYGRHPKVGYVPDFGELTGSASFEQCRMALGVPETKTVVLVYGFLNSRKGIAELIQAAAHERCPGEVVVVLAGSASNETSEWLQSDVAQKLVADGRLVLRLYFHNDCDEYVAFMSSDYVWLGYVNGFYASSGVLSQAALAGKPVLAMKQGLIGLNVRRHSLGIAIDPQNREEVIDALCLAVRQKADFAMDLAPRRDFAESHSSHAHATVVLAAIIESRSRISI
jgi:glycosyltransferase involved in cell wall biosynthesis